MVHECIWVNERTRVCVCTLKLPLLNSVLNVNISNWSCASISLAMEKCTVARVCVCVRWRAFMRANVVDFLLVVFFFSFCLSAFSMENPVHTEYLNTAKICQLTVYKLVSCMLLNTYAPYFCPSFPLHLTATHIENSWTLILIRTSSRRAKSVKCWMICAGETHACRCACIGATLLRSSELFSMFVFSCAFCLFKWVFISIVAVVGYASDKMCTSGA